MNKNIVIFYIFENIDIFQPCLARFTSAVFRERLGVSLECKRTRGVY